MPQAKRNNDDVWYVDEVASAEKPSVPPSEIDGLVSGFIKIKSQRIRNQVMALIAELTREDRKI